MVKITRHNSLWSKVAVLLFAIHPIQDRPAQTKIEHLGDSERDRNISCEAAILGKHVISDSFVSAKQLAVSCPASKSDLVESLVSNGVTVTETGDWAYLVPTRLLPPWKSDVPVYMRLSWKALIVDWQVTNFPNPGIPGSRPLSLAELREVESQILSHGRMIPIADPASETDPAIIPLRLVVDCHRLSAKGPESVIAVLHQDPTTNP